METRPPLPRPAPIGRVAGPPDLLSHSFSRRALNLRQMLFAGLAAAVILSLNLYAPAAPSPLQRLLASLLLALCALPTLIWASGRDSRHSLMPYCGLLYGMSFAAPVFVLPNLDGHWYLRPRLADPSIDAALLLALTGWTLLLAAYFGPRRRWLARLPRLEVFPASGHRLAAALAVVLGAAAAPFFYLDCADEAAFYLGRTLVPPPLQFPVELAGQLVVLSVLILFHLELRGRLRRGGRIFLWSLVTYYTLLGFSTGLANHGLKAVVALFVAHAIAARAPTWRGAAYGTLTLALLVFVVLPIRGPIRRMLWTHGVDSDPNRLTQHVFRPREATAAGGEPIIATSHYLVFLSGEVLRFSYADPAACTARSSRPLGFFLHPYPADLGDLPSRRTLFGYANLDFLLNEGGQVVDGRCVHEILLPAYEIDRIVTGLIRFRRPGHARGDRAPVTTELVRFVAGASSALDTDGEWRLITSDAASWEIDSDRPGYDLLVVTEDGAEFRRLASIGPGDPVRIELDPHNWADYRVSRANVIASHSGFEVRLDFAELAARAGDRASLADGGSAILRYETAEDDGVLAPERSIAPVTPHQVGPNSAAPLADAPFARVVANYALVVTKSEVLSATATRLVLSATHAIRRLDFLLPLAWLVERTPEDIPYAYGQTYYPILVKPVPRLLWPDKPKHVKDLGQTYGFLPADNEVNAFKVHQLGELYLNFGVAGVLLGFLALGALYRALYEMFCHDGASVVTLSAGAHMLTVLLVNMESLAAVSAGFLYWYAIFLILLWAVVRFLARWRRVSSLR